MSEMNIFFRLIPQMTVTGLLLAANYILVATGFNLTFGIMKMVNFAHGTFYMLGAYLTFVVTNILGLNYFLGVAVAMIFTFCLGWLCEKVLLRGRAREDILMAIIITLGLLYILMSSVQLIFGELLKGVKSPIQGVANIHGVVFPLEKLLPALLAVVFVILLHIFRRFTKTGQSLVAVADDREAAALMGININRSYMLGFAVGVAMAGVAGALMAAVLTIEIGMGTLPLWKTFVIVILGGVGSLGGCILAGLLLGLLDSFLGTLASPTTASIVGFIGIILVLLFRPEGFMGEKIEV